jgi:predicted GNAT family N-acyltransferase
MTTNRGADGAKHKMISCKQITTTDAEYESEKALRDAVLRRPLGMSLSADDLRGEDGQIHWVAIDEAGRVVGCVLLDPGTGGTGQIRQMAVAESRRGRGIGAALIARIEETARGLGIRKLLMHARAYARGFYERQGYHAASDVYIALTIPHIDMEKELE